MAKKHPHKAGKEALTQKSKQDNTRSPGFVAVVVIAILVVLSLLGGAWLHQSKSGSGDPRQPDEPVALQPAEPSSPKMATPVEKTDATPPPPAAPKSSGEQAPSATEGSFLDGFLAGDTSRTTGSALAIHNESELESHFQNIVASMEKRKALTSRMQSAMAKGTMSQAEMMKVRSEAVTLSKKLNTDLSQFEKELKAARESNPDAPVTQWLTGELLQYVGGEPADTLPYFERAVAGGLKRPHLYASLARSLFESNRFPEAYQAAIRCLKGDERDRYFWDTYARVAMGSQHFEDLKNRIETAFPDHRPDWAAAALDRASRLSVLWQKETAQRKADEKSGDLPRVRLHIQHRKFARDSGGSATSRIENTGTGVIDLELFEDQAPQAVANFVSLVEKGFYDGTLFSVGEAASMVQGGDPNTKNDDPSDDGRGGPGYTIEDEFGRADARPFFRGSLGMINAGPGTSGSQFFITLIPIMDFNGRFTAFGRVIAGQDVVDAITQGRTSSRIGHFGRAIPGDVIVQAEILRKRNHPYTPRKKKIPSSQ